MRKINKKGFQTVNLVIGSIIGLMFLITFAYVFMDKLTDSNILTSNSIGDNITQELEGNFSLGVAEVNESIPTVLGIAVFVLIIVILLIAYNFARRNGLIGNSQLG